MVIRAGKHSGQKRWVLRASLAIIALIVLVGGLLAWQPAVLLRATLWLSGHDEITFDQLRVGLHELELTGLALGRRSDQRPPNHLVSRLTIDYRSADLLRGRIEGVSVEGLRLRGRIDQDGFRLEGLDVLTASPDEPAEPPALPIPDRVSIRDARLELTTPFGALSVPFTGQLRPEQDRTVFVLEVDRAQLAAATGQLSGTLHVEGELPSELQQIAVDPQAIAAHLTASGRFHLSAETLGLPGLADGLDGAGELTFVFTRGQLNASVSGVGLQLDEIAPEWEAIAELLPAPWQVEIAQPVGISASFVDDGIRLEGSGQIALATAGPQLEARLSTTLSMDADGQIRELVVPDGKIDLRDLRFADMRLDRGSIQLQGNGSPEAWQGSLALDLAGAGAPVSGFSVAGALQTGLDVRFADGRLSALVRDPGMLQISALSWADDVRVEGVQVRLQPSSEPLLSAELADGRVAWQQHVAATLPEFEVVVTSGETPVPLTAAAEKLEVELAGDGMSLAKGRVVLTGGAVHALVHEIRASGIATEVGWSADGLDPGRPIPVSIASIVHEGKPPWFTPLRLHGSVQPQGDQIAFDVELGRTAGDVTMRMYGQHDLAGAEGQAELDLPAVEFAPGRLQPAGLAPGLADVIEDVSGRMALDGSLHWGAGGGVRADLDLLAEDLAFSSGPARFAQVNGVIAFDRLAPLSTPPGQQLAIGLVDIGLPLTNGLLTFDLEPDELVVEQLRWQFAEGRIRAAPFTIGSGEMQFSTILTAERLKLDEIFALAQLDGLTGEGTMHGTLPITVAGSEAVIDNGELVSDRPGWVRYRPDEAPAALQAGGENVNLLLQALENFRYEELRLTIDGRTDGEMDVGLHIAGANPDLYDGYPIEFNLNLEGALAEVLRAGLAGYQIPERIRERMQGFGR
jgi:Dicarboxylate transport